MDLGKLHSSLSRYNLPRWMRPTCDGFGQVEITTCCRPARDRTRAQLHGHCA